LRASAFGAAGLSGFFSGFLPKREKTKANQRYEKRRPDRAAHPSTTAR
jgi:hypothetical protein